MFLDFVVLGGDLAAHRWRCLLQVDVLALKADDLGRLRSLKADEERVNIFSSSFTPRVVPDILKFGIVSLEHRLLELLVCLGIPHCAEVGAKHSGSLGLVGVCSASALFLVYARQLRGRFFSSRWDSRLVPVLFDFNNFL